MTELSAAYPYTNIWHFENSIHVLVIGNDQNSLQIKLEIVIRPEKLLTGCKALMFWVLPRINLNLADILTLGAPYRLRLDK